MHTEFKDDWTLKQTEFNCSEALAWESLFTQGSGYLQLRGSFEEKLEDSPQNLEYARTTTNVSAEKFIRQSTRWGCYIPGVYSPNPTFNIKWRRIVHARIKKLILQQVFITSDKDTEIMIVAGIDGDVRTNGHDHFTKVDCRAGSNGCLCTVETEGGNTVEVVTKMASDDWKIETSGRSCTQVKKVKLKAGEQIMLEKRSALSWG